MLNMTLKITKQGFIKDISDQFWFAKFYSQKDSKTGPAYPTFQIWLSFGNSYHKAVKLDREKAK